jgi:hypothetical protein
MFLRQARVEFLLFDDCERFAKNNFIKSLFALNKTLDKVMIFCWIISNSSDSGKNKDKVWQMQ